MPSLVKMFMDREFVTECDGHTVRVEDNHDNTGHGMTYLNRLIVCKGDEVVYDSGMLEWRTGLPGHEDSAHNRFINPSLKRVGEELLLGVLLGNQTVEIYALQNKTTRLKESFDVGKAEKFARTSAVEILGIEALKKCVEIEGLYYQIGNVFQCDLGPVFLAYHNGHPTDVVWDYIVAYLFRDGRAYVSSRIPTQLRWHDKFTDSTVLEKKVEGNSVAIRLSSGHHRTPWSNPVNIEFELKLEE